MCTVCGCGEGSLSIDGASHHHHHEHEHEHEHEHGHGHEASLHYGKGPAHAHAPGLSQSRMVRIEQDILAKNGAYAEANRRRFDELGLFALNLVSSPGSGKTSLLTASIRGLRSRMAVAVIEGDQQTQNDAARIRDTGARAVQVNTGKGCHLDAHMVGHALEHLLPLQDATLMIENVGNLVCPAGFDLGEAHKVAVLSVTEGEDKPLKYPDMFHAADLMLLNKVDLLPYLDFDVAQCIDYARRINPDLEVIQLSATTGQGMEAWLDWVEAGWQRAVARRQESVAALKQRIAELEARLEAAGLSPDAA
ncbi:hydrogenase nickel incorporation protein HypB [Halomonas faecis]|uniref:hydrogenase nickel incorporation protein HypB n=1 Tax=Halomonas faecis TaxID=1562110 RepID=UPI0013D19609|nr:hydrogenase nickel incorporation protein HypB [Halomonas faecis]